MLEQLEFLKLELKGHEDIVNIVVSDNHSNIKHIKKIQNFHASNYFFKLIVNETNLGLIGNIDTLFASSLDTKYIWFLGDDDVLLPGVLKQVLTIISQNDSIPFIYLNNNGFVGDITNVVKKLTFGKCGYIEDGADFMLDVFLKNGAVFMFISSCIYSSEQLKRIKKRIKLSKITDPLLYSFGCGKDSMYWEPKVYLLDRYSVSSYSKDSLAVFSWLTPFAIVELENWRYSRKYINRMLYSYYSNNRGNYLRMLLQAPMEYKLPIIRKLGIKQFSLLVKSFINNLRKLMKI